ncbi:helix-turn-helix domain-containing protein [Mammaliicoccus sciuri]|uniref:helix-turn-helix domain-containing protein n=1 Tax=Mammaliicoccus sciuri TaxID=1296 RepID=UPI003A9460E9
MTDYEIEKLTYYVSLELKHIRKRKKILQDDIAFELNVTPQYIGRIENGYKKKLSLYMFIKIADYYGIPFNKVVENAQARMELDNNTFENN